VLYPKPSLAQAKTTQPRNNLEDLISLLIRDNQTDSRQAGGSMRLSEEEAACPD